MVVFKHMKRNKIWLRLLCLASSWEEIVCYAGTWNKREENGMVFFECALTWNVEILLCIRFSQHARFSLDKNYAEPSLKERTCVSACLILSGKSVINSVVFAAMSIRPSAAHPPRSRHNSGIPALIQSKRTKWNWYCSISPPPHAPPSPPHPPPTPIQEEVWNNLTK